MKPTERNENLEEIKATEITAGGLPSSFQNTRKDSPAINIG